jgi:glycosyltransferase involved in cell wall biosynthesis
LRAWAEGAPSDLDLVVIGDGPERSRLEAAAPARVRFLGRLEPSAVRQRMLAARALLFPTRWYEGQPIVLLEAFAAGLPVVGTDIGGVTEMLRPTPEWLVSPEVDSWSKVFELLGSGGAVDAAGSALRRSYEQCFTPEIGLELLEDAYLRARTEPTSG